MIRPSILRTRLRPSAWLHLAVLLGAASSAQASALLGNTYSGVTPLYTLSQTSGTATTGPATGLSSLADLASSGQSSTVWGVGLSGGDNQLYRINGLTGAIEATLAITGTSLVNDRTSDRIVSLALNAATGVAYGTSAASFGGLNQLYSLDTSTGAATLIGSFGLDKLYGLAFNPGDGQLYATTGELGEASTLWRINTSTALATAVGTLASSGNFDLAFRPEDNVLFMASSGSMALYTVNTSDATQALVGGYGASRNIAGLAFINDDGTVPEPGSLALVGGALLACWRTRRRAR